MYKCVDIRLKAIIHLAIKLQKLHFFISRYDWNNAFSRHVHDMKDLNLCLGNTYMFFFQVVT